MPNTHDLLTWNSVLSALVGALFGAGGGYLQGRLQQRSATASKRRLYLNQARFFLSQLVKAMAVALDFPEETAGNPDAELADLRTMMTSTADPGVLADSERKALYAVLDVMTESLRQIRLQREILLKAPGHDTSSIKVAARTALSTIYEARRRFGFSEPVQLPTPHKHQKWTVGTIPGSSENEVP